MNDKHSEYPLHPDHELHCADEALFVDGVGWLGQYHSYLDNMWEKGTLYFVRDYYMDLLAVRQAEVQSLCQRIQGINSKLSAGYHAYNECQSNAPAASHAPVVGR